MESHGYCGPPLEDIDARKMQGVCYDCGRRYGEEFGFPDLVVHDDVWEQISPSKDGGGLLCPSCICRRLYLAGIETKATFKSGPLCIEHVLEREVERLKAENENLRRGYQATGYEGWPCPGCRYENGEFIEACELHKRIQKLIIERDYWQAKYDCAGIAIKTEESLGRLKEHLDFIDQYESRQKARE